jgi:hypothetical protein
VSVYVSTHIPAHICSSISIFIYVENYTTSSCLSSRVHSTFPPLYILQQRVTWFSLSLIYFFNWLTLLPYTLYGPPPLYMLFLSCFHFCSQTNTPQNAWKLLLTRVRCNVFLLGSDWYSALATFP